MNTILLQKILDLLKDNLTGVGTFIKSVFVHDPQDNQVLTYDAGLGKWVNKDVTEVELDLTNTFEDQAIATLTDGAENVPMKSLVVDIVPQQASGTPTPSSPLPISGSDEVVITHIGVNQWNEQWEVGGLNPATGGLWNTTDRIRTKNYISVKPNWNIYIKYPSEGVALDYLFYDINKNFISSGNGSNTVISIPANAYFLKFATYAQYGNTYNHDISINYPSTDTAYHPYQTPTTHTIALPSTVYGGEVDVVSGKLRVTWGKYTITNDTVLSNFTPSSAYGSLARVSDIGIQAIDNSKVLTISNMAKGVSYDTRNAEPSIQRVYTDNEGYINIRASSSDNITNASVLKTLFMGAEILYMLATPIEIDLTPTTIKTMGGTESIFSDTGDVSGEYYTKTAESVIALANITEDITSSVTKNTTDFTDILLKVSQNNKVVSIEIYSASTSSALIGTFLSNLPKPAMNSKVLLANTTIGEDGIIIGTLKTTGELEISTTGAKSFSGLITYVVK